MANNIVHSATAGMGQLLSYLAEIQGKVSEARALINLMGWELPPGVEDIGLASLDLSDFLEKLDAVVGAPDEEWEDELAMVGRIADLTLALTALAQTINTLAVELPTRLASFGDYVDRTNIHKELPKRLLDFLLVNYLANKYPLAFAILHLIDVIDYPYFEANPAIFQVEHLRAVVHYSHFKILVTDPEQLAEEAYGWSTPQFNAMRFLTRLSLLFQTLGLRNRIQTLDQTAEEIWTETTFSESEPMPQLITFLHEERGAVAGIQLGLSIFGARPTSVGATDGGLGVVPIVRGEVEGEIPLHAFEDTVFEFSAQAEVLKRIALILRPNLPLQVQTASSLGQLATGRFAIGIRQGQPGSEPKTLVSFPGGSRLSIRQFTLTGGLDKTSETASESFMELGLLGCEMTFSLSEADGFLSSTIARDRIEAPFDVRIGWTSSNGIYFHGGAGLDLTVPLHAALGPISLESLHLALDPRDEYFDVEASTSGSFTLGPLAVTFDRLGLLVNVSFNGGNLGVFGLSPRFKPPTGLGLVIDAAVVVGGGYLFFDAQKEEYGGILQLEIADTIAVKAIGLLTTRMPDGSKGFSLVVIITAEGFPPIQLGFGFTLTGIGGLLGVNRTVMVDVLRSGLKNGTLGSILFPDDPIRNAPQIVSDLRAVFPPVRDRYVFGPMAIIGWGTPAILTLEIGLILELPEPVRLIILGRLQAVLPDEEHALVQVRMDAIGVIDFNQGEVSLDATLYDSRILAFVLTGDMALRANWGAQPNFILAIGGFNPRFPTPAGFPQLARLALSLGDSDNPRLRFESYLALTSNTVQFGARLDFSYSAAGFTLAGLLGFDALFQFAPFQFIADVGAMVALKRGSSVLMGLFLDITLAGPTPWHVWGKATFKVLFFKVSIRFDHRFGHEEPPALPEPIDVLTLLADALGDRRNWSSALPRGEPAIVSLRDSATTPATQRVHPLAQLTVRQRVVPLNRPVMRFGNAPLAGGTTTFTVAASGIDNTQLHMPSTMVRDAFALAQYQEMSDEEKLARPAFETQDAGLQFGVEQAAYQYETLTDTAISYETLIIDPTRPAEKQSEPYVLPQTVLEAVVILGAAGQAAIRRSGSARYRALERAA
jgi:hypothetical protein